MEAVDANIIVTALAAISRDFGSDPVALKIAITSYIVGLGMCIPVCGWLADRFGTRTIFRIAIGIFVAGSLMCASSRSLYIFTVARFVQGVGGAMMVPVGRIIVVRAVPKSQFFQAMDWLNITWIVAPALAPVLGGFATTYLHWRVIFIINVPIGVALIYLSSRHIANLQESDPGRFDLPGSFLSATGASLLLLGLSLVGSDIAADATAWGMSLVGISLLALYALYARRAELPTLDLRFFNIPTFRASVLGGSMFRLGYGAVLFLLPLSLQVGLGMTAFESGLLTCASASGSLLMRPLTALTLRMFGFRTVLIYNAALSCAAMAATGTFAREMPLFSMWVIVLVGGFFYALQVASINSLTYADITESNIGRATSLGSVVQYMSLGLGVAIGGLVLEVSCEMNGHMYAMSSDFLPAFFVAGLFSLGSIPFSRRLPTDAGNEMAGGATNSKR
ncbi:MFS transporter [Paraburkholderia sp. MM5477-R1]|uniref:MFS transporter n=1 Tax=Paraburkholderia sp. MM5477-R1 TaxID=2991062 RepID=UPI003D20B07D